MIKYLLVLPRSHINRRTQFENPVLEAKRRMQQQQQMQSQGLSALPLPTIYRGTAFLCGPYIPSSPNWFYWCFSVSGCSGVPYFHFHFSLTEAPKTMQYRWLCIVPCILLTVSVCLSSQKSLHSRGTPHNSKGRSSPRCYRRATWDSASPSLVGTSRTSSYRSRASYLRDLQPKMARWTQVRRSRKSGPQDICCLLQCFIIL